MIPKLNLASTFAALVCFFLPWLDVQCSGKSMATQSGIQVAIGKASAGDAMNAIEERQKASMPQGVKQIPPDEQQAKGGPKVALLTSLSLVALLLALGASIMVLRGDARVSNNVVGILCAASLSAIIMQMLVGFPLENDLTERMKATPPPPAMKMPRAPGMAQGGPVGDADPFAQLGAGMAATMLQIKFSPALYLAMFALGIPVLVFANGFLDEMKKARPRN